MNSVRLKARQLMTGRAEGKKLTAGTMPPATRRVKYPGKPGLCETHHPITMIGIMNSSRLTVYPYGVASAGGICVGAGIRTVCRAIPAGTATIASMATTSNALFCGSEALREEGLDIRGTSRNFRKFCITVPLYRKHYY